MFIGRRDTGKENGTSTWMYDPHSHVIYLYLRCGLQAALWIYVGLHRRVVGRTVHSMLRRPHGVLDGVLILILNCVCGPHHLCTCNIVQKILRDRRFDTVPLPARLPLHGPNNQVLIYRVCLSLILRMQDFPPTRVDHIRSTSILGTVQEPARNCRVFYL